ncbi:glucokinase [Abditibacteriota bacterium]|nr:glucokinase [Abditibacteriota bacterium]
MHLGIDLGGTTCTFGLLDDNGQLSATSEIETRQHDAPDVLLGRIAAAAKALIAEGEGSASVQSVGIGVPGPVKHKEGICVFAPNLQGWVNLPVGPILSERIGVPVHVLNDANAAALGEARYGAGSGANDVLVVTLGTGIGSGLILDGHLHIGASERGAEIGHMTVDINDKRGSAGNVGTLESMCGRDAIVWRALRALTWGRDSLLHELCPDLSKLTPRDIAIAAEQGDEIATRVWFETASYLAVGVVNVIFTADVSRVVLAGGVAQAGDVLLLPLRRAVAARTSKLHFDVSQIVMATIGNRAGLIGAAQWAREQST